MEQFNEKLYQCLTFLGIDFSKLASDKNERIRSQKYSYLISAMYQFPLEYIFKFCELGPYSLELMLALSKLAENLRLNNKNDISFDFDTNLLTLLNKIKDMFPDNSEKTINNLIIFTSFIFIQTNYPSFSKEEQFKILCQYKKAYFTENVTLDTLLYWRKSLLK